MNHLAKNLIPNPEKNPRKPYLIPYGGFGKTLCNRAALFQTESYKNSHKQIRFETPSDTLIPDKELAGSMDTLIHQKSFDK